MTPSRVKRITTGALTYQWLGWTIWAGAMVVFSGFPLACATAGAAAGGHLALFVLDRRHQGICDEEKSLEERIAKVSNLEAQLPTAIGCASPDQRMAIEVAEQMARARRQ